MPDSPGLHAADTWSRVGIISGACGGLILAAIDITWWLAHGSDALAYWVHSLLVGLIVGAVLISAMAQVGVRVIRGQQNLMAQVHIVRLQVLALAEWRGPTTGRATVVNGRRDEHDTEPEPVPQEQLAVNGNGKTEVEGLSAEMVEIARRTSARLRRQ